MDQPRIDVLCKTLSESLGTRGLSHSIHSLDPNNRGIPFIDEANCQGNDFVNYAHNNPLSFELLPDFQGRWYHNKFANKLAPYVLKQNGVSLCGGVGIGFLVGSGMMIMIADIKEGKGEFSNDNVKNAEIGFDIAASAELLYLVYKVPFDLILSDIVGSTESKVLRLRDGVEAMDKAIIKIIQETLDTDNLALTKRESRNIQDELNKKLDVLEESENEVRKNFDEAQQTIEQLSREKELLEARNKELEAKLNGGGPPPPSSLLELEVMDGFDSPLEMRSILLPRGNSTSVLDHSSMLRGGNGTSLLGLGEQSILAPIIILNNATNNISGHFVEGPPLDDVLSFYANLFLYPFVANNGTSLLFPPSPAPTNSNSSSTFSGFGGGGSAFFGYNSTQEEEFHTDSNALKASRVGALTQNVFTPDNVVMLYIAACAAAGQVGHFLEGHNLLPNTSFLVKLPLVGRFFSPFCDGEAAQQWIDAQLEASQWE